MRCLLDLLGNAWLACGIVGAFVGLAAPFVGLGYLVWGYLF